VTSARGSEPEPELDADEADVLEQATAVEERPALDTTKLGDPTIEADAADLFEQAQTIPANADEDDRT
jgi:hypothetical protein